MSPLTLVALLALFFSALDWRKGVLITVAVGFLADPIRKLIPGQPVSLTIAVAVFALTCLFAALGTRGLAPIQQLSLAYRRVTVPLQIFFVWVVLAAFRTIVSYDSFVLAGIGTLAYLAPLPGLLLAYYYASSKNRVDRFITLYVTLCIAMTAGIYLDLVGFDWEVLRGVGPEMQIVDLGQAYSGFFRTPEVAAWHAGAAVCLIVILMVTSDKPVPKWLVAAVIVFLMIAGLLTGRRKMVAQVVLFSAFYGLLLTYYRSAARRLATLGLIVALVGGLTVAELVERSQLAAEGPSFQGYLQRGTSVFQDAPERMQRLGLGSVAWAIRRHGWMGVGAGVSSQGSQHFGGGAELVGGAGEGGLGKIVTELGIPGLAVAIWLLFAAVQTISRKIAALNRIKPELASLACGLAAFLAAQIPTFVAAAQIYGDPFVLIVLGSVLGFLLAAPQLAQVSNAPGRPEHFLPREELA